MSTEIRMCYQDEGPTPEVCRYKRWPYCFCPPSAAWSEWASTVLANMTPLTDDEVEQARIERQERR